MGLGPRLTLGQRICLFAVLAGAGSWAGAVTSQLRLEAAPRQSAAVPQAPARAAAPSVLRQRDTATASDQRALIERYCVGCHNSRQKSQNATPIALDALDLSAVPAHPEQ